MLVEFAILFFKMTETGKFIAGNFVLFLHCYQYLRYEHLSVIDIPLVSISIYKSKLNESKVNSDCHLGPACTCSSKQQQYQQKVGNPHEPAVGFKDR